MSDDSPTNLPDDLTNQPTAVTGNDGSYTADAKLAEGAAIGRYRIIRLIGEGGMGAVYEAEQDQPRRTVALKVIKPGLASPELLRRFTQESQALGRLQHPGIAQIYEAGTADTGFGPQPYFAMEFIRGKGLRDYVEERHLNTRDRLEIVARVCDAVHHAHQRGLIHRDLKPGNILVDDTGQPKILDFGVARVTDSDAQATMQTDVGQLVGTLAYMSPEQVLADPLELDTRSDVYALGVIFYELLAARLPYNISKKLHEALQAIREEDPARLSSINRIYKGDIETIAAKALEKDKARRYASAAELAADIRHYLKDEPIVARPPSTSYQLQKFARRHKALVLGIAAVFVVLVGGVIAATLQAVRAGRAEHAAEGQRDRAVQAEGKTRVERDRATTAEQDAKSERDRALTAEEQATSERNRAVTAEGQAKQETAAARALNDFLRNDVLALADPLAQLQPGESNSKPNPNLTVRELLDKSAARMTGKFDKQPLVEAALRETIGGTYSSVGAATAAQQQLERALDLRSRNQGETNAETLSTMGSLAGVYNTLGRRTDAEALLQKAVDGQIRMFGEQNSTTLASMSRLAGLYAGNRKFGEAEKLVIKVMDGLSRIPGRTGQPAFTSAIPAMVQLAQYYGTGGRPGQADELVGRMEAFNRPLPENDPFKMVLRNIIQLAQGAITLQSFAQNLNQSQGLRDISPAGQETQRDVEKLQAQADLWIRQGKFSEAESVLKRTLEAATRLAGKENHLTVTAMAGLAGVYLSEGKLDSAEELWVQALNIQKRTAGEDAPETLNSMAALSNVYRQQGKTGQARDLAIQRLDLLRRALSREDPEAPGTRANTFRLAVVYGINGKYKEAEEVFTQVLESQRRALGDQQETTVGTKSMLGWVRVHQQKYAEAESAVREALAFWGKTRPNSWERYNTESILGAILAGQKKFGEAEERLLSGHDHLAGLEPANLGSDIRAILEEETGQRLVQLYLDWGKPEQAAEWRKKTTATGPQDTR